MLRYFIELCIFLPIWSASGYLVEKVFNFSTPEIMLYGYVVGFIGFKLSEYISDKILERGE